MKDYPTANNVAYKVLSEGCNGNQKYVLVTNYTNTSSFTLFYSFISLTNVLLTLANIHTRIEILQLD